MTPEQKARQQIDRQLEQTGWIVLVPQDPNDEPASVLLEQIRASRSLQEMKGKAPTETRTRKTTVKPK
jgi:hypothetical protein